LEPEIIGTDPPVEENLGLYFFGMDFHAFERAFRSPRSSPMMMASSPLSV
jgi:hypothetical protein